MDSSKLAPDMNAVLPRMPAKKRIFNHGLHTLLLEDDNSQHLPTGGADGVDDIL